MDCTMPDEPRFVEEHKKMTSEPILPIERKLVVWSIATGVVLLFVLVWLARR